MQTEETYGFIMDFNETDHTTYIHIKDDIERLCRKSESLSKYYNKNPLIQSVQINNNTFITCAVYDNKALFGVFQPSKSNEIIQHATKSISQNISLKSIQMLENRIENTAKNKKNLAYGLLREAWDRLIEKQKAKDIFILE